uniref:Uncharacterized protein n=1 Tax=Caenorhabditis japonica TaxID=281687 RepID=A0A8R1IXS3_CAEJA
MSLFFWFCPAWNRIGNGTFACHVMFPRVRKEAELAASSGNILTHFEFLCDLARSESNRIEKYCFIVMTSSF